MALFNTERHHEAMGILLGLVATSHAPYVRQYRRAIELYARDLNATV